jgi:hypothetical protein
MAQRGGKEWSPKKFSFTELHDYFVELLESAITAQRISTRFEGKDEDFHAYVANKSWDHYAFKLIGENTGSITTLVDIAAELGLSLPEPLVLRADYYSYLN